jgi:hypothetical protein
MSNLIGEKGKQKSITLSLHTSLQSFGTKQTERHSILKSHNRNQISLNLILKNKNFITFQ